MFEIEEYSDEDLKQKRKEAEEVVSNLTIEEYYSYRIRAKTDLFFLCVSILQYSKFARLHFDVSKWHKETKNDQYREILLPRSHYKSTELTIGGGIQLALPDDTNTEPWPSCLGTNCRILLGHEVRDSAALFLNEITQHFLTNPLLMGLFPECVPDPKKHRINKNELELPRLKRWKEPTFSTIGTGGSAQGQHFNFIKADDLIGAKARDSPTEMEGAKLWIDNIQALLVTPKEDHIDFIGTRWAYDDVYAHIEKVYGSKLKRYVRGIEEKDPITGERRFIFPENFDDDSVEILRKNKKVFASQYANDPKEGASEFQEDWKQYYKFEPSNGKNLIVFGEGDSIRTLDPYVDLDRVILVDPAMSGLGGVIVTGEDKDENIFILEAHKKDWQPTGLIQFIFMLAMKWQPRIVGIEHVLFSALFSLIITNEMAKRGVRFQTYGLKTFGKAKDYRVRGLSHYFEGKKIWFHPSQLDLLEEYDNFGATDNYHMLDALAHGPQVWRKPIPQSSSSLKEIMPVGMDRTSGYSSFDDDEEIVFEEDESLT